MDTNNATEKFRYKSIFLFVKSVFTYKLLYVTVNLQSDLYAIHPKGNTFTPSEDTA